MPTSDTKSEPTNMTRCQSPRLHWLDDGRDEMSIASFPISVSRNHPPPLDAEGTPEPITYEASYFDPKSRRYLPQRVTLNTSSKAGYPVGEDEKVIVSLISLSKHSHDFQKRRVYFSPQQLFSILGWRLDSGGNYARLYKILAQYKALDITFERAWWNLEKKGYDEVISTGIISEFRIVKHKRGWQNHNPEGLCWVEWTGTFHESLKSGCVKKLDLNMLFSLETSAQQKAFRYLDKRFCHLRNKGRALAFEIDVREFFCGHVGLAPHPNIAELKRRGQAVLRGLEKRGVVLPQLPQDRYSKVKKNGKSLPGIWRVGFEAGSYYTSPRESKDTPHSTAKVESSPSFGASDLVKLFYRSWLNREPNRLTPKELSDAEELLSKYGEERAREIVQTAPKVLGGSCRKWEACSTFFGVVQYLPEILKLIERKSREKQELNTQRKQEVEERGHEKQIKELLPRARVVWENKADTDRLRLWNAKSPVWAATRDEQTRAQRIEQSCIEEIAKQLLEVTRS